MCGVPCLWSARYSDCSRATRNISEDLSLVVALPVIWYWNEISSSCTSVTCISSQIHVHACTVPSYYVELCKIDVSGVQAQCHSYDSVWSCTVIEHALMNGYRYIVIFPDFYNLTALQDLRDDWSAPLSWLFLENTLCICRNHYWRRDIFSRLQTHRKTFIT